MKIKLDKKKSEIWISSLDKIFKLHEMNEVYKIAKIADNSSNIEWFIDDRLCGVIPFTLIASGIADRYIGYDKVYTVPSLHVAAPGPGRIKYMMGCWRGEQQFRIPITFQISELSGNYNYQELYEYLYLKIKPM